MVKIGRILKKISQLKPAGFWPGFLIGLVYFGWIFSWLWSINLNDALAVKSIFASSAIILILFALSAAIMATFWGIFSFFIIKIVRRNATKLFPIAMGGLFSLAEYFRAWAFGIFWSGHGVLLGPHWTFGNLAYYTASLTFISRTASVWGIYGIDFILASTLGILCLVLFKVRKKYILTNISVIVFFLLLAEIVVYQNQKNTSLGQKVPVTMIQTFLPTKLDRSPDEFLTDFNQKLKLLDNVGKENRGGIVIFPEGANLFSGLAKFLDLPSAKKYFNNLSIDKMAVIDNIRFENNNGSFNSRTILLDSKNGVIDNYNKRLLAPAGEYIPYIMKLPLLFLSKQKGLFKSSREFNKGTESKNLIYDSIKIKPLVCSDIISPSVSRTNKSDLIVGLNNLGLFGGNGLIESQLVSMFRFRAIENNKYAVLASNLGHSYVINNRGEVIKSSAKRGYEILTADVEINKSITWYNRLGDWPVLILSVLALFLTFKNTEKHGYEN